MELCSLKDTPRVKPNQLLFKQNTWRKWMGFLLTLAGSALLLWFASEGGYTSQKVNLPPFILYWTSGVAGLLSLILLFYAKASMRPSNWLARYSSDQLIVKLRSHLNDHFSDEDRVVAIIPVREIDWVRTYRETLSMPVSNQISGGNSEELETHNYLELKLDEKVISLLWMMNCGQSAIAYHRKSGSREPSTNITRSLFTKIYTPCAWTGRESARASKVP